MYAEKIIRDADLDDTEEGVRIGGRVLNNLRYADDTTLAAESESGLKVLLERVTSTSEKAGLYLNIKKTKVMSNTGMTTFRANNESIEVVKHFNFLGSMVEDDSGCCLELTKRLAMGRATMVGLTRIWKDRDLTKNTKAKLVKTLIFPIATYGCETWTLNKALHAKVAAFEIWCWRRMLRVPWTAKRTNASILEEIRPTMSLENIILNRKLSYFGHVIRGQGLESTVMLGMGNGQRNRGRPRKRWIDEVRESTGLGL